MEVHHPRIRCPGARNLLHAAVVQNLGDTEKGTKPVARTDVITRIDLVMRQATQQHVLRRPATDTADAPQGCQDRRWGEALETPLVAMDVVEVAPAYDWAELTVNNAHRAVLEVLSGLAMRRGDAPAVVRPIER